MTIFDSESLIFVTGKGGVGKTTVASALGIAAASRGLKALVCELSEGHCSSEVRGQPNRGGSRDRFDRLVLNTNEALGEWLDQHFSSTPLVRPLLSSQLLNYIVAATPGAKELIALGYICQLARSKVERGDPDLIIVDAPASGHAIAMLESPTTWTRIATSGPINDVASRVKEVLSDPQMTRFVVVTTPEESPVMESLIVTEELKRVVGRGPSVYIVNRLQKDRFTRSEKDELQARSTQDDAQGQISRTVCEEIERVRYEQRQVRRLRREATAPIFSLAHINTKKLEDSDMRTLAMSLGRKFPRNTAVG